MLTIIILVLFSCKKEKNDFLEIKIRGLDKCLQIIRIDEEGNGVFSRGSTKEEYRSISYEIENVEMSIKFDVKEKKVLDFIKFEINRLRNSKYKKSSFAIDAQRYILTINGVEKIDSYAAKSNEIHEILKKLHLFLPEKLIYSCSNG